MYTRADYVIHGTCNHRQYYAQFVTEYTKSLLLSVFGLDLLREGYKNDPNTFNHEQMPLKKWDALPLNGFAYGKFPSAGDYVTLSGVVCVYKEAARQLVESEDT